MSLNRRMACALMGVAFVGGAAAADAKWPDRPIRLVIPYAPGSATDVGGRILAEAMGETLGQTIIIDNRGGASGTIGSTFVSRAKPDGYTLLLGNTATHGSPKELFPTLQYDPLTSFEPVSTLYRNILGLFVTKNFPASTLPEFITYVRAHPDTVSYGIPGKGTVQHLASEVFAQRAGLKMRQIPYQGGAAPITDLEGGHLPATFGALASVTAGYRAGRIKVLAILSQDQLKEFEGVPTVASVLPGFDYAGWGGLFAPKGTDPQIVNKLNNAVKVALQKPKVIADLNNAGLAPLYSSPAQLTERTKALQDGWEKLRASGVKIDD